MRVKFVIKYLAFTFVCLFMVPLITRAECDYQRQAELSRLASNVQFSYNYKIVNSSPEYTVNISNITNDIYVTDNLGNRFAGQSEFMHKYYIWDNKADYTIYSNDNNCKGEVLLTKHISFPYYNQYSVLPECQKYASSELCSIWYDTSNYSELEFIDALTKVGNTSKELFKAEDNDLKTTVLDVIMDNLVYVVLSAIGILILIIFIVLKVVRR